MVAKGVGFIFGYVRINKGELKVKEYEAYRGIYCSVCRSLGKNYGPAARMILSYDMTFLAMVRLASDNVVPCYKPGRCPFNPSKKCNYCTNCDEELNFVCAAAIIMFYYKVRDNISDSPFFKKILMLFLLPFAIVKRNKAKRLYPEIEAIIAESIVKQTECENKKTASFDEAAHSSAEALGKIFALNAKDKQNELYRFGYFVGRWVYLIDAADDLKSDIKYKSFNVFVNNFNLTNERINEDQVEKIRSTLNMSCACAIDAFEKTEFTVMLPVIENILFDGMEQAVENILKGKNK